MADELRFRTDLFRGTAEWYDAFRPPYPDALIADLRRRLSLDRSARVLDLACGTGQVAFALAADVAEVVAVDQEVELVEFGRSKSRRTGTTNVRWVAAAAEAVELDGTFELVAIGNAFHRLDREAVARRLVPHVAAGGGVALLWGGSPWQGDRPWQRALDDALRWWTGEVGAGDRVPQGWQQAVERDRHEQVLRRVGLTYEGSFDVTVAETWTVDSLVGFVCSTSFLNRAVLGDRIDEFERDLRRRLLRSTPDGGFDQDLTFTYELARRPASS